MVVITKPLLRLAVRSLGQQKEREFPACGAIYRLCRTKDPLHRAPDSPPSARGLHEVLLEEGTSCVAQK